jgi:hypothetical protein
LYEIEPCGTDAEDWRMNMLLGPHVKKGTPFLRASDAFSPPSMTCDQSSEEQIALLRAFNDGQSRNAHG